MSLLFRTFLALALVTAGAAFAQDSQPHDHEGHEHSHATTQPADEHAGHDHATEGHEEHAESHATSAPSSEPASQPASAPAETSATSGPVTNATCPVMGQPVNEQFQTTHDGKTVLFCCAACVPIFEGNPERYLAQLPQFSESTE